MNSFSSLKSPVFVSSRLFPSKKNVPLFFVLVSQQPATAHNNKSEESLAFSILEGRALFISHKSELPVATSHPPISSFSFLSSLLSCVCTEKEEKSAGFVVCCLSPLFFFFGTFSVCALCCAPRN